MNSVPRAATIRVPASTSNLGAAFDAVGLALRLYLRVEVQESETAGNRIEVAGEDAQLIPCDESNLIWRVARETALRYGSKLPPCALRIENEIPITKGLGSSAAACLAGAAAASFLCGLQLTMEDLLREAAVREGHPDNVAPALLGGLVSSISGETILCSRSEFPSDWSIIAVTPQFELQTSLARSVLPSQVPRQDAVFNVQRAAFLMAQLVQGRREGLREAMRDALHQPYRCALIPGLAEILSMQGYEGLLGIALSGAGSTVVALADSNEQEIGRRIGHIFSEHGLASQVRVVKADNDGLSVTEPASAESADPAEAEQ